METLVLRGLPELREWASSEKKENAPDDRCLFCSFPRLRMLTILFCGKLTYLPDMASSLQFMRLKRVGVTELPGLQCQGDQASSLSRVDILKCPLLTSLNIGFLESRLPYLRRLTINNCGNLQFPPTNGFKDFESLEELTIRKCPNLLRLSKVSGTAALPCGLRKLWIEDCECIEENSLEASLHPQLVTSLQQLTIRFDELHITISSKYNSDCFQFKKRAFFNWERKEVCSRVKLVICILQSLEPGRIEKVDICETRDGISCSARWDPSFNEPIKSAIRLQYGCRGLGTLAEGCLAQMIPLAKSLKYVVKRLTLEECPYLKQIGTALPPLQELVIYDCQSLDINSIQVSLQASLPSLQQLVLHNFCRRLSNIFLKWIMAHFLRTLDRCDIHSSDQAFQFYWKKIECRARIAWDDGYYYKEESTKMQVTQNQETTRDNDCTRNEVLEEMLRKIAPSHVRRLSVLGIHEVTSNEGHLEQLFSNLTSLSSLQIHNCQYLRSLPAEMSRLSSLKNVQIVACDNFKGWEHAEAGEIIPVQNAVRRLKLRNNNRLCSLPYYSHLEELDIECCNGIQDLSILNKQMPLLQKLVISHCANLKYPPQQGFMQLINLRILILKSCPMLLNLSQDENCYNVISDLSELVIENCKGIQIGLVEKYLPYLTSLEKLVITNCGGHISSSYVKKC